MQRGTSPPTIQCPPNSPYARFFSNRTEPEQRGKMVPPRKHEAVNQDDTDIIAQITQLPSKTDLADLFQKLEESFGVKYSAVSSEVQHLGDRVQALEDEGGDLRAEMD
ncbi:Hypothetical predicted protein [Pelobates cultripes]|uniref:Uncharacterized protein n=1 Tax=Pelobates cultripes TaxID=61616 RepID=A0AAD1SLX3_PELCU|nr:Hypothetical predicted protein [Pelobates cultripes]